MNSTRPHASFKKSQKGNQPKRHHWWPQLQSGYWTGDNGLIHVVKPDGSSFGARPVNVGVEGELYTRYEITGEKDLTIERWFSSEIETPFARALERLVTLAGIIRLPRSRAPAERERQARELGFLLGRELELLPLEHNHRNAIDAYLAALLVRNPIYLAKLIRFHDQNGTNLPDGLPREQIVKAVALDNMLEVFELYRKRISEAGLMLTIVACEKELLFSDSGITAKEPWQPGLIPFDIHAPLTPKLALQVLPVPGATTRECHIARINAQGVARYNRIALSGASRFVFSRGEPPIDFIKRHFGVQAPQPIARRLTANGLEASYDRSRDASGHI